MAVKKEDDFDDFEEKDMKDNFIWYIGAGFLILSELFFYLLSVKTEATFGIVQIIFGILAAVSLTLFMTWIRYIMKLNKYMAMSLSLLGIAAVSYALTRKYSGIYTTTFLLIGIVISLVYTIVQFVKFSKK